MTVKIIPIADYYALNPAPVFTENIVPKLNGQLIDTLMRPLRDLRISVTDRCNFRCVYCMPKEVFSNDYPFVSHHALLSFEEITRLAHIFVAHGVEKIRLTGGEPLLRKGIDQLITMLSRLKTPNGHALDLTLTTNASLLTQKAQALKDAGLKRITVSLDALDEATFKRMNDVAFPVTQVLRGLEAAHRTGLSPIKINMIVKRGMNNHEILPMARYFKDSPFILRFIEYMDVGASNGWKLNEVIPSDEIVHRISTEMPLERILSNHIGETAERWRYKDGSGEIGLISSVTHAFCHTCTRARLSAEGKLHTCLFSTEGFHLRELLRTNKTDKEISDVITSLWQSRKDRYSELRTNTTNTEEGIQKVEMSYIGG